MKALMTGMRGTVGAALAQHLRGHGIALQLDQLLPIRLIVTDSFWMMSIKQTDPRDTVA